MTPVLRSAAPRPSAFAQLRTLLADVPSPAGAAPLDLHLGECRLGAPTELLTPLADPQGWTRYPSLGGTPLLRAAYLGWLRRRFAVDGDGDGLAVEPTPGTKQAVATLLALAVADVRDRSSGPDPSCVEKVALATVSAHSADSTPAVVLPNPFYPTYLAATEAARARAVLYPVDGSDVAAAVTVALRSAGPVAAVVVCHPGNPRGDVLDAAALRAIASVAAEVGALLVVDECYVDLYAGTRPAGYLAAVPDAPGPFAVLHSLSKRSSAPGLRSGFVAGDAATVTRYADHNRACGVSAAAPVCAAAAALWADDAHVERLRDRLGRSWDTADALLADVPGYRRPPAGFFLWLPLADGSDDESVTRRLWAERAVSVMPGRYLATEDDTGTNPGAGHLRVALAHPSHVLRPALRALRATLLSTGLSTELSPTLSTFEEEPA